MDKLHSFIKEDKWQPEVMLDPKDLNMNTERNQYYTGTIGDLTVELHCPKYFTLIGATSGYWMV